MLPPAIKERQTDFSEHQRAWTSLVIAMILFGMAALFYFAGEGGVFTYVAALPALFGVLLVYGFVHSLLASKTPPTTILVPEQSLKRGVEFPLTVRQYGPARLESLRVNLICEKSVRKDKSRDLTYPHQISIFDSGPFDVAIHDVTEFPIRICAPIDAEPTRDDVSVRIIWRLEIWGKVIGRADFMRPFEVVVE
jgi:hypothetical protein